MDEESKKDGQAVLMVVWKDGYDLFTHDPRFDVFAETMVLPEANCKTVDVASIQDGFYDYDIAEIMREFRKMRNVDVALAQFRKLGALIFDSTAQMMEVALVF